MSTLGRQWRAHVGEGAVVQWILRKWREWRWPEPTHIALVVRRYDLGSPPVLEYVAVARCRPGETVRVPLAMPYAVPAGADVLVEISIRNPLLVGDP